MENPDCTGINRRVWLPYVIALGMEEGTMKRLALAVTALTFGVAGASAQSQTGDGGTVMLTPEQRAAVRSVVRERLPDELREKVAERVAERLEQLTPEQRNAVRAALKERIGVEVREGLSDRIADRLPGIGNN
jgi:hypothetical protein